MHRKLTVREWILLGLLAVIALVSGYVMLFCMPMTARRDTALSETELCRVELEAARLKVEEKRRMERELEALFADGAEPVAIADYDNLQPVMFELHTILSGAEDYSLSFGTVDTSQSIVRRSISLSFTSRSYESARDILEQNGISTTITAQCLGNVKLITGNAVAVHEPVTGVDGLFWITADSHTVRRGVYQTKVTLDFRNLMDGQTAGSLPKE